MLMNNSSLFGGWRQPASMFDHEQWRQQWQPPPGDYRLPRPVQEQAPTEVAPPQPQTIQDPILAPEGSGEPDDGMFGAGRSGTPMPGEVLGAIGMNDILGPMSTVAGMMGVPGAGLVGAMSGLNAMGAANQYHAMPTSFGDILGGVSGGLFGPSPADVFASMLDNDSYYGGEPGLGNNFGNPQGALAAAMAQSDASQSADNPSSVGEVGYSGEMASDWGGDWGDSGDSFGGDDPGSFGGEQADDW